MTTRLNVAYVGNGKSVNRYHVPFVLARSDRFRIKTIYSRSETSPWPRAPGVAYANDFEAIASDRSLDLVVVCTPLEARATIALELADRGFNCLLEKPFASTASDARRLFDLARARGVFLGAYHTRRYDGDYLTAKRAIESKRLGTLWNAEFCFDAFRPDATGSIVFSRASHLTDQAIALFGAPERTRLEARRLVGNGCKDDEFEFEFYYGALKVALQASFRRVEPRPAVVLNGSKGCFIKKRKDRQEEDLKLHRYPGEHLDFGLDAPEDYGRLIALGADGARAEERVPTERGDYGRVYDDVYASLVYGAPFSPTREEIELQIGILESAVAELRS